MVPVNVQNIIITYRIRVAYLNLRKETKLKLATKRSPLRIQITLVSYLNVYKAYTLCLSIIMELVQVFFIKLG